MAITVVRQKIVAECNWGVGHTADIHYAQIRPTPNARWKAHLTPITTDCSGSAEAIFYSAGAPDPSGYGYNGEGNTSSIYANAEHIPISLLQPGDMIICFMGTENAHMYIVLERLPNNDFKMFSHGAESDPKFENYSAVSNYWTRMVGCRTLPLVDKPSYDWTVLNGLNQIIGHTAHPVTFAVRHPTYFRKYNWVRFRKDVL